ncbi:MAG: hypothetical protein ACTHKA_26290 [Anaerocolumna jejuensis]
MKHSRGLAWKYMADRIGVGLCCQGVESDAAVKCGVRNCCINKAMVFN